MQTMTAMTQAPRPMEHRWGERVRLDSPARLFLHDGEIGQGRVRDASISGALIETKLKLTPFTPLTVAIATGHGPTRRNLELPACVTRRGRDGIAVEWRDMATPALIEVLRAAGGDEARLCTRDRVFGR